MTTFILGYRTALAYWSARKSSALHRPLSPSEEMCALAEAATPSKEQVMRIIEAQLFSGIEAPLDLISTKRSASLRTSYMRVHGQLSPLPPGSITFAGSISGDEDELSVFVSTPELCLVQMGCFAERHELAELAIELCGDYALRPDGMGGTHIIKRPHATTADSLRAYIARAADVHGVKRARFAAECVVDSSRSPRESQIALEMTLSYRLGGYGLPRPKLNEKITLEGAARRAAGVREIYPDFYWPNAGLVLEYDSDAFHSDSAKRERDIRKRNAYEMLGLHALSLTHRQFTDQLQFACIMEEVGRMLGYKTHALTAIQQRKRAQLHGFLTHGSRLPRL